MRCIGLFLVSFLVIPPDEALAQPEPQGRVIVVSVDGLRPDVIQEHAADMLPGFQKLMDEGVFTLNARSDAEYTLTLPNHVTMVTGRQVGDSHGHNWWYNSDVDETSTLHEQNGDYVASMFDVAHDHGARTGVFSTKARLKLLDQSYDAINGAQDQTGADNGRDKIDTFVYHPYSSTSLLTAFRSGSAASAFDVALFHIAETDEAGHGSGWNADPESAYGYALRLADLVIQELLLEVSLNPHYNGNTHVIVTSDHGGKEQGHWDPQDPLNNTIPFFVWGPTVQRGDLYAMNTSRWDPGNFHLDYTTSDRTPPVRNGDVANLALSLIGLPAVPGSTINTSQDLVVAPDSPSVGSTVTMAFQDGVSPTVSYDGTRDSKIMSGDPTDAFGFETDLEMDGHPASKGLLFWDVSAIPLGSTIQSARIQFDVTNISTDSYGLYAIERSWDEASVSWENASDQSSWTESGLSSLSDRGEFVLAGLIPDELGLVTLHLNADGIEIMQQWVDDPTSNHGLVLEAIGEAYDGMDISSSESGTSRSRPRLEITFATSGSTGTNQSPEAAFSIDSDTGAAPFSSSMDASASSDPDGAIESWDWDFGDGSTAEGPFASHVWQSSGVFEVQLTVTDNNGATASATRIVTVTEGSVQSVSFQHGVAPSPSYSGGQDTKLLSTRPATAFGQAGILEVDGSPDGTVLMAWDLSSIAPGTPIQAARISLDITNPSNDAYHVKGARRTWDETNATWNVPLTGQAWGSPGANGSSDRNPLVLGLIGSSATGSQTFELNQDGVALIQQWIDDPTANHGFVLQNVDAFDGLDFSSRNASDPLSRPRLTLDVGSQQANRNATITSDTGASIHVIPSGGGGQVGGPPSSLQGPQLMSIPGLPGLAQVRSDRSQGDEIRIHSPRSSTVIVLAPEADSSAVTTRLHGFARDRTVQINGSARSIWIRVLPAGSHVIDLGEGEWLYVEHAEAVSTHRDRIPAHELPEEEEIAAFPNPFRESLTIRFDAPERRMVEMIDMTGRRVFRAITQSPEFHWNTESVPAGTYVLRISTPDGQQSTRMVTRL